MTSAHIEKFAELLGNDPALSAKLGLDKVNADAAAAAASAEAFITHAVKDAKHLGLIFTEEELQEFMDAEMQAAASGELSDTQLEAVAGGGTTSRTVLGRTYHITQPQIAKPSKAFVAQNAAWNQLHREGRKGAIGKTGKRG